MGCGMHLSRLGTETVIERIRLALAGDTLTPDELVGVVDLVEKRIAAVAIPPPSALELLVAGSCNLDCDYCFLGRARTGAMDVETASSALELLAPPNDTDPSVSVCFFGGEPLPNVEVVAWVLSEGFARLRSRGMAPAASMTTNGTLVTQPVADLLAAHRVAVMVSIDGDAGTHNRHRALAGGAPSHALAVAGAIRLREAGVPLTIRVTVAPDCVRDLAESVHFACSLRPDTVIVRPVDGAIWPEAAWCTLAEALCRIQAEAGDTAAAPALQLLGEYRECLAWGCGAGVRSLAVGCDGAVVPCSVFLGSEPLCSTYTLGHVQTDGADSVLASTRRREAVVLMGRPGPECEACDQAQHCSGGCPGHSFGATGGLVNRDPMCCRDIRLRKRLTERRAAVRCGD